MKRFIFISSILMFPLLAVGATEDAPVESVIPREAIVPTEALSLSDSLKALQAIDRSSLTRTERRELRRDIKTVNNQIGIENTSNKGGLMMSLGPLVVVIVLLIIFL